MNWGIKIIITLALFIAVIVSFGVYMVSNDTDTLEIGDYYEQGLQYDEVYRRRQNVRQHEALPRITIAADTLTIQFVQPGNKGQLLLRRPSDQAQDVVIPFDFADRLLRLPMQAFSRGAWELQLEWEAAGIPYQFEKQLFLSK